MRTVLPCTLLLTHLAQHKKPPSSPPYDTTQEMDQRTALRPSLPPVLTSPRALHFSRSFSPSLCPLPLRPAPCLLPRSGAVHALQVRRLALQEGAVVSGNVAGRYGGAFYVFELLETLAAAGGATLSGNRAMYGGVSERGGGTRDSVCVCMCDKCVYT